VWKLSPFALVWPTVVALLGCGSTVAGAAAPDASADIAVHVMADAANAEEPPVADAAVDVWIASGH